MAIEVRTEVDRELSLGPSYIVRYQLFEGDSLIGAGVVQYHREACHNDVAIPSRIKMKDGSPLTDETTKSIKEKIAEAALQYIKYRQHT